jgi:hypothetical protein
VNRSIPALAIAGALVLGSALAATPAQATPGDGTYYSVPFSGELYTTATYEDERFPVPAGFDEWAADGFPTPVPASVAYRTLTWASTIYADVQTEPGAESTVGLSYSEWRTAGMPTATSNVLPSTSSVYKHAYSDELFVAVLSYGDDIPVNHKLTFSEFAHLGYPRAELRDQSFQKLSWLPSIVGPDALTGEVGLIDFWTWDYWSRPTPQIVTAFDGDRFCQAAGSPEIRYVGVAAPEGARLSYGQWREAGFPAPARC